MEYKIWFFFVVTPLNLLLGFVRIFIVTRPEVSISLFYMLETHQTKKPLATNGV